MFTIQGYTELKVAFCRGLTGKKLSQILCFLRLCRSQFRALSNYLQLKQTIFFSFSLILLSKSSRRVHGTRFCMLCLVSRTWSWICEKDGGDVASPAGLSSRTLPRKCKSGPMPPSRAKNWRQKSANPALFPVCTRGQPPGMAADKCITLETSAFKLFTAVNLRFQLSC